MSELSTLISQNQKSLKSSAFHHNIYAIVLFVLAGFMILAGVPMLLAFGLGLIYIAFGVLYIFLGLIIKKVSTSINSIAQNTEIPQDEFNTNSINVINQSGKYYKILNIFMLVSIILGLVLGLVAGIAFATYFNSPEFKNTFKQSMDQYDSSMMMNSKYQSTLPNQTMDKDILTQIEDTTPQDQAAK
jgi:hypothetical protein